MFEGVEKFLLVMYFSQPQEGGYNMKLCWSCDENWLSHTETGAENHCKHKTELPSQAEV
jgi:hypothetical protein